MSISLVGIAATPVAGPALPRAARGRAARLLRERGGEQRDERLELHVGRGDDTSSEPSSARAASPALLSMSSAMRASMVCAAMIRQAVTGMVCPMRWLRSMACVCSASVQDSSASTMFEATCRLMPDAGRGQRADRDGDLGVVDEGVDVALARRRRLVAADRGVGDALPLEGLLGHVHDVDVLGEEDHLAGAAGELGRVVGGQPGLGLADAPHHAEHVLAGGRRAGVLELPARRPCAPGRRRCPRRRWPTRGRPARSRSA